MTHSSKGTKKKKIITLTEIIGNSKSEEAFLQVFENKTQLQKAHRVILTACYRNPDLSPKLEAETEEELVKKWLEKYKKGYENRISQRKKSRENQISQPKKSKKSDIPTRPDPMIEKIISARLDNLKKDDLKRIIDAHRLAMSAENVLGRLLEEFLAEKLLNYGWYYCWGECILHVDFCKDDGSLLQVKNRSNSENSSSSKVRINKPIDKWYRIDAKSGKTQWLKLKEKCGIEINSEEKFEDEFRNFIEKTIRDNEDALYIEEGNLWANE